jgi:RHS repeat-associated protein
MLTGLAGKIMTYDGENRPLSVTHLGKRTCYVYGIDGKRLKKVEGLPPTKDCTALPANANTTVYFGAVEVRNWLVAGSEQVLTYPHPSVKLLNGVTPAAATYMHRDGLGSVRAITSAAGVKIESAVYKPLGEQSEWVLPGNAAPETKGWIGERFDADAGLQYLNARYYDPELSLFLQPDWFEVTKAGVGTNRFSYSFNDPVNKLDPAGNYAADPDDDDETEKRKKKRDDAAKQVKVAQEIDPRAIAHEYLWREATIAAKATAEFGRTVGQEAYNIGLDSIPVVGGIEGAYEATTLLGAVASIASEAAGPLGDLAKRAGKVHSVLDPIAARSRTTAVMETLEGTRIVASGGRDLTPAQRAALEAGEIAGKQRGAHAEVTAIDKDSQLALSPSALVATRDFCPACSKAIEDIGGVIIDAGTAIWE